MLMNLCWQRYDSITGELSFSSLRRPSASVFIPLSPSFLLGLFVAVVVWCRWMLLLSPLSFVVFMIVVFVHLFLVSLLFEITSVLPV